MVQENTHERKSESSEEYSPIRRDTKMMKTIQNDILSKLFAAEEKFKNTPRVSQPVIKKKDVKDEKLS